MWERSRRRMRRFGGMGRRRADERFVAHTDPDSSALDFELSQVVPLEQIHQLLDLRRMVGMEQRVIGLGTSRRIRAREHDRFACRPAFLGFFSRLTQRTRSTKALVRVSIRIISPTSR